MINHRESDIMTNEEKDKIILFRYGVIAPLVSGSTNCCSNNQFFVQESEKVRVSPKGVKIKVSSSTIERWYLSYKKYGIDGLTPQRRTDIGLSRKIDQDIIDRIKDIKLRSPRLPSTEIHRIIISEGVDMANISLSTVNRIVNRIKANNLFIPKDELRRYEREHINEVWCGDSCVGPYLYEKDKKVRLHIVALIDDASRLVVGAKLFRNDNYVNLLSVLKSSMIKYGKPKMLNFDNGKPYKNKQVDLLSARVGFVIRYCEIHKPIQKAKIERWFRTLRDHWMAKINYNDFKSLEEYQASLEEYVKRYNQTIHSSLEGKSPMERFLTEIDYIIRMPINKIETDFLLEITRKVSVDNVIKIDDKEYEVEDIFYANKRITIRYDSEMKNIYLVDNEKLAPIKLLNKKENSFRKRQKITEDSIYVR